MKLSPLLVLFLLVGCGGTPLELPTCEVPRGISEVQEPLSLPHMPQEISSTDSTATFNIYGITQLERFRQASLANVEIAKKNAEALQARNEEVNALIECSRYQNVWMEVREEMLEQERRDHALDNFWHRGIILLGAIAGVTL